MADEISNPTPQMSDVSPSAEAKTAPTIPLEPPSLDIDRLASLLSRFDNPCLGPELSPDKLVELFEESSVPDVSVAAWQGKNFRGYPGIRDAMEEACSTPDASKQKKFPSRTRITMKTVPLSPQTTIDSVPMATRDIAMPTLSTEFFEPLLKINPPPVAVRDTPHICTRRACNFLWTGWRASCPMCGIGVMRRVTQAMLEKVSLQNVPMNILDVVGANTKRFKTGVPCFDQLLGDEAENEAGYPHVAYLSITGAPGAGKSTLLTQIAAYSEFSPILYVTSEEKLSRVKNRWERLKIGDLGGKVKWINTTSIDEIETWVAKIKPQLLILDSINEMFTTKRKGVAGSRNQLKYIVKELRDDLLSPMKCSAIFVCQLTKNNTFAGPKFVEHLVDMNCSVLGMRESPNKYIAFEKNRDGPVGKTGYFELRREGIFGIGVREGPPPTNGEGMFDESEVDEEKERRIALRKERRAALKERLGV